MTRTETIEQLGWTEVCSEDRIGWILLLDEYDQLIARYPEEATLDDVQRCLFGNMDVVDGDDGQPLPDAVMRAHTMLEEARRRT